MCSNSASRVALRAAAAQTERRFRGRSPPCVPSSSQHCCSAVPPRHNHRRQSHNHPSPRILSSTSCTRRSSSMPARSEEHTSELQSLMRISYAVFCLKKKKHTNQQQHTQHTSSTNQNTHI